MRENTDQNNSEYGRFLRSDFLLGIRNPAILISYAMTLGVTETSISIRKIAFNKVFEGHYFASNQISVYLKR